MPKFAAAPIKCQVETPVWKCPHCQGTGWLTGDDPLAGEAGRSCPYCGGTGKKSQRVAKHDPRCGRWSGKACTGGLR